MDIFIKKKDLVKAALVAHEIMLQENVDNELTLSACLFSCMSYLDEIKRNNIEVVEQKQEESNQPKVNSIRQNALYNELYITKGTNRFFSIFFFTYCETQHFT